MAKASKKRGKKKPAKQAKKSRTKKSTKRAPAKRKSSKRKPARKTPAKRKPSRKKPAKRAPAPQAEPWPMIFAVLLVVAAALIAAWHFSGPAEAAVFVDVVCDLGVLSAAGSCAAIEATAPMALSAVSPPELTAFNAP